VSRGAREARPVDPRLVSALREQLATRRRLLEEGATHVGWKLGTGERESIGGEIAVGYLTSATRLEAGATYEPGPAAADLRADAELAVELDGNVEPGADAASVRRAIARYAAALELVDLAHRPGEPDSIVVANVYHRAFAFGPWRADLPPETEEARLVVDGIERARGRLEADVSERLIAAARLLGAVDEGIAAGDQVITGLVVQVRAERGREIAADLGPLGAARLAVAP
jgi:hypothetical protein